MRVVLMLLWAFISGFYFRDSLEPQLPKAAVVSDSISKTGRATVIIPAQSGMFEVGGKINGHPLPFLLDTGSYRVSLSYESAIELGILPKRGSFTQAISTANGVAMVAEAIVQKMTIGSVELQNVEVSIFPRGGYQGNLLGMSFLRRVRWSYRNGHLLMEQ